MENFINKLIDQQEFEIFVKSLYDTEGSFIVERNVSQVGKSGAKRQIDVKLTNKILFHEYITIIECKRWKEKVDRTLIDILSVTIEDLNAAKGVLFTTKGYEKGAIDYAKAKGIDLFLFRDLTDEEWGLPGREIRIYFRIFGGNFDSIKIPKAKVAQLSDKEQPNNLKFDLEISQKQKFDENLFLQSNISNTKGKHLLDILFDSRISIFNVIGKNFNFDDLRNNEFKIGFDCDICLDFSNYEFCILNYPEYVIWLDKLYYKLRIIVNQFKYQYDKGVRWNPFLDKILVSYIVR